MEELIQKAEQFSLEFVGRHLYIYGRRRIADKKGLYDVCNLARDLCSELAPTLERMEPGLEAMKGGAIE